MNENEKNQEHFTMTRRHYILSVLFALIIGIGGTLLIDYLLEDEKISSEDVNQIEQPAQVDSDTQFSFDDREELSVVDKLYTILMTTYFEEIDSETLIEGALEGMAGAVGDPYTEYLDQVESSSFEEDISGSFQGIGAEVMKDGEFVRIVSPIANSPAERVGLQPNDLIVEVDGESVAELTINEAVALIRGPQGTDVELLVIRGEDEFYITLTRAEIPVETVYYEVLQNDPTIGYVKIVNFNIPTYQETIEAIEALTDQGVERIIFDVRGNPGGLLTSAIQISNIFVPDGEPLMMTEYRSDETPTVYRASADYGSFKYEGEAVLLVNEGSASASEILAGAMRSVDIPIYGTTTFGKGTVQSVIALGEEDEVKFTSGKWLTADGEWINEVGIIPDQEVGLPEYSKLFIVNSNPLFNVGTASSEANNLKKVLSALGYTVTEDAVYDESVVNSLEAFQASNGLPVSGEVTSETARLLTNSLREKIEANDTQLDAALESFQ